MQSAEVTAAPTGVPRRTPGWSRLLRKARAPRPLDTHDVPMPGSLDILDRMRRIGAI